MAGTRVLRFADQAQFLFVRGVDGRWTIHDVVRKAAHCSHMLDSLRQVIRDGHEPCPLCSSEANIGAPVGSKAKDRSRFSQLYRAWRDNTWEDVDLYRWLRDQMPESNSNDPMELEWPDTDAAVWSPDVFRRLLETYVRQTLDPNDVSMMYLVELQLLEVLGSGGALAADAERAIRLGSRLPDLTRMPRPASFTKGKRARAYARIVKLQGKWPLSLPRSVVDRKKRRLVEALETILVLEPQGSQAVGWILDNLEFILYSFIEPEFELGGHSLMPAVYAHAPLQPHLMGLFRSSGFSADATGYLPAFSHQSILIQRHKLAELERSILTSYSWTDAQPPIDWPVPKEPPRLTSRTSTNVWAMVMTGKVHSPGPAPVRWDMVIKGEPYRAASVAQLDTVTFFEWSSAAILAIVDIQISNRVSVLQWREMRPELEFEISGVLSSRYDSTLIACLIEGQWGYAREILLLAEARLASKPRELSAYVSRVMSGRSVTALMIAHRAHQDRLVAEMMRLGACPFPLESALTRAGLWDPASDLASEWEESKYVVSGIDKGGYVTLRENAAIWSDLWAARASSQ